MKVCNLEEDITGKRPTAERPYNCTASGCWYFEPDSTRLKPLEGTINVAKVCGLCIHYQEAQNGKH